MSNLDIELRALKGNLFEMMTLAVNQIKKCKEVFVEKNLLLAKEVVIIEKRINFLELALSKDCENILALYNPVATDLRFVLAVLRINNDLERIGDNAKSISKFAIRNIEKTDAIFIEKFELGKMFDVAIDMLTQVSKALEEDNAKLAKDLFEKDSKLNEIKHRAPQVAAELIEQQPKKAKLIIRLLALVGKLERVGDLTLNISEEVVFHVEAKVIKHKKRQ